MTQLRSRQLLLATLVFAALAILVQYPYFTAPLCSDDLDHLYQASLLQTGKSTPLQYLFAPHNEHLLPFWRLWYYVVWRFCGVEPWPWHACISVAHVASAVLLFQILNRYFANRIAAWIGAGLWSAAAIGGWDNPLLWVASSHLSLGVTWMLLAMVCVVKFATSARPFWLFLMGLFLCVSVLTMAAMILLAVVLPLQWLLLESDKQLQRNNFADRMDKTRGDRRPRAIQGDRGRERPGRISWKHWVAAWLLPCVLLAGIQLSSLVPEISATVDDMGRPSLLKGAHYLLHGYALALANLLGWPTDSGQIVEVYVFSTVAASSMVFGVFSKTRRKAVVVIFATTLLYSLAAYTARSQWPADAVMGWGRMRYLPTLAWCVPLAALAATLLGRVPSRFHAWTVGAVLLIGVGVLSQQCAIASRSRVQLDELSRSDRLLESRDVLRQLSRQAVKSGWNLKLPDIPISYPKPPQTLSVFAAMVFPDGLKRIEILPVASISPSELDRTVGALEQIGTPDALGLARRFQFEFRQLHQR